MFAQQPENYIQRDKGNLQVTTHLIKNKLIDLPTTERVNKHNNPIDDLIHILFLHHIHITYFIRIC